MDTTITFLVLVPSIFPKDVFHNLADSQNKLILRFVHVNRIGKILVIATHFWRQNNLLKFSFCQWKSRIVFSLNRCFKSSECKHFWSNFLILDNAQTSCKKSEKKLMSRFLVCMLERPVAGPILSQNTTFSHFSRRRHFSTLTSR